VVKNVILNLLKRTVLRGNEYMFDIKPLAKITLLHLYMFFVGPLIWGIWMVARLKIITLQEFLHCLLSPISITILMSYFIFNFVYIRSAIKKSNHLTAINQSSEKHISSISVLKVHCASIITFGTLGTALFMITLSSNKYSLITVPSNGWIYKAIIGSLSGASLVFLFYVLFSVLIFINSMDLFKDEKLENTHMTFKKLGVFNFYIYVTGLLLFIGSVIIAYTFQIHNLNMTINFKSIALYSLSSAFPIIMSLFLYRKSIKKLQIVLSGSHSESVPCKKLQGNQTKKILKWAVRLVLLTLFFILLIADKTRIWLIILFLGFCISLIAGRVYCRCACPVNTVNAMIESLYRVFGIKKRSTPSIFRHNFMKYSWVVLLCFIMAFIKISEARLSAFIAITLLGIIVSAIFNLALWCKFFCPWSVIFKIINRIPIQRLSHHKNNPSNCMGCLNKHNIDVVPPFDSTDISIRHNID
jgi:hypothetical protein